MKEVRFSVAQVAALCGGKLPHADGFAWERVGHFRFENGAFEPYYGEEILPGPSIFVVTRDTPTNYWDGVGRYLGNYMKQVTDERLDLLYHKLYDAGWDKPQPLPLRTVNANLEIMNTLMRAVSVEIIERREGRISSVK